MPQALQRGNQGQHRAKACGKFNKNTRGRLHPSATATAAATRHLPKEGGGACAPPTPVCSVTGSSSSGITHPGVCPSPRDPTLLPPAGLRFLFTPQSRALLQQPSARPRHTQPEAPMSPGAARARGGGPRIAPETRPRPVTSRGHSPSRRDPGTRAGSARTGTRALRMRSTWGGGASCSPAPPRRKRGVPSPAAPGEGPGPAAARRDRGGAEGTQGPRLMPWTQDCALQPRGQAPALRT